MEYPRAYWSVDLMKETPYFFYLYQTGIPHFLEQDDEYQGYLIPGQSLIIGNIW
jgi:hypothetical protein